MWLFDPFTFIYLSILAFTYNRNGFGILISDGCSLCVCVFVWVFMCANINGFVYKKYARAHARTRKYHTKLRNERTNKCRWYFCGPNRRINFNIYNWERVNTFPVRIYQMQVKANVESFCFVFVLPCSAFFLN